MTNQEVINKNTTIFLNHVTDCTITSHLFFSRFLTSQFITINKNLLNIKPHIVYIININLNILVLSYDVKKVRKIEDLLFYAFGNVTGKYVCYF